MTEISSSNGDEYSSSVVGCGRCARRRAYSSRRFAAFIGKQSASLRGHCTARRRILVALQVVVACCQQCSEPQKCTGRQYEGQRTAERHVDFERGPGRADQHVEAAEPGTKWAIGTEVHMVNRLKNENPDKLIQLLSPFACLCSTMYRISPLDLANVLENLVEGRVINQISVAADTKQKAKLALDRMLSIPK